MNKHTPISPSDEIIEALLEAFTYNAETGNIKHNLNRPMDHFPTEHGYKRWLAFAKKRAVIGTINNNGYININFRHVLLEKQRMFKAHHIAWLLHHKEWPTSCLDHVNQDKTDNRIANLRIVTSRGNQHNRTDQSELGVGVTASLGNFQARIRILGVQCHIGRYNTANIASKAYDCVLMSFSDNFDEGPNGLSRHDLKKTIASIEGLTERVSHIHNKVQEVREAQ